MAAKDFREEYSTIEELLKRLREKTSNKDKKWSDTDMVDFAELMFHNYNIFVKDAAIKMLGKVTIK